MHVLILRSRCGGSAASSSAVRSFAKAATTHFRAARFASSCGVPKEARFLLANSKGGLVDSRPRSLFFIQRHLFSSSSSSSSSSSLGDSYVFDVPTMGDSITEGTVVEWVKNVGDYVGPDEVFVVIETDKVSVDVRSPDGGIILEALAAEDDNVEVGAPLVKFERADPPPEAAAAPAATADPVAETGAAMKTAISEPPHSSAAEEQPAPHHGRVPRIHFRHGNRSVIDALLFPADASPSAAALANTHKHPPLGTSGENFPPYLSHYGRLPPLTPREEEMLRLGGAFDG